MAKLIVHRELATPLATAAITGHDRGGFYGLENTPRRMMSGALRMKTPVPGLYLSGQDVVTPGIFGAMWGGLLAGGQHRSSRLYAPSRLKLRVRKALARNP